MSVGLSTITDSYGRCRAKNDSELDDDILVETIPLFGRAHETALLLDTYQRVARNHSFEVVVIHGESGSGKSALANSLRRLITTSGGYFCAGKCFQNDDIHDPYSAIMAAFSDLCDLVSQSEDFDEDRKRMIQDKLGSDVQLLSKSISNLAPFIADSCQANVSWNTRAETEFKMFKAACRSFLYAMSSEDHPIVLFLDDIQWMDEGSRQLVSMLLQRNLVNVMLVLTYREEASSAVSDWLLRSNEKRSSGVRLTDIFLNNLTVDAVNQIVAYKLLSTNLEETVELSQLIASKTKGNAFHVIQFIEALKREGLVSFIDETSMWDYDVEKIQSKTKIHDSLADLLARKIQRLSPSVLKTMKIASLLGYSFATDVLLEVYSCVDANMDLKVDTDDNQEHVTEVTECLEEAFRMGFTQRTTDGFQFVHDKLQSAFSSMFDDDDDFQKLHRRIGETYLKLKSVESTFHAAVHLNQSPRYVRDATDRLQLAKTNLDASKFCCEKSSFLDAAKFLRFGLAILDPRSKWTENFDLAFEMTEMLAKVELVCSNFVSCRNLVSEVMCYAPSLEMKLNSLLIGVQCSLASNKVDVSAATAIEALRVCGLRIPRNVTICHVLVKLIKVRRLVLRNNDDAILNLPRTQDRILKIAIHLLFLVSATCLLQEKELLALYAGMLATELTIKLGVAPHSPCAFTVLGIMEVSLGNIERGYRLGKLALGLQDRLSCRDAEALTVALSLLFLLHWKEPAREHRILMHRAMESGLICGDLSYSIFCASLCNGYDLFLGENLQKWEQTMRDNYSRFGSLDNDGFILMLQPALQFVVNMQMNDCDWADLTSLTGEIMDEDRYVHRVISENNRIFLMIVLTYKSILNYNFGFYTNAVSIYKEMASRSEAYRNSQSGLPYYLYGALIYYEEYRRTKKRNLLQKARRHVNSLKAFKSNVPNPNVAVFLRLLDAVDVSVHKSATAECVMLSFDNAIMACAGEHLVHMEALANELAGFACAGFQLVADAERYFSRAENLYLDGWGATSKFEWLRETSQHVLSDLRGVSPLVKDIRLGDIIETIVHSGGNIDETMP